MKLSIYDEVLSGIVGIIEEVSDDIAKEFKGKAPFDREAIPEDELLYEYNTRGGQAFRQIADTQGMEAATNYIRKMEALRNKKQGGNNYVAT